MTEMAAAAAGEKSADAFRTISEVAEALKLPQHVLRFWETRFVQIKPLKRAGGRRFYRPQDVELVGAIRQLLYGEGYTIKGVQRILREQGPRAVTALAQRRPETPFLAPVAAETSDPSLDEADDADLDDPPAFEAPASVLSALRTARAELAACRRILVEAAQGSGATLDNP